MATTTPNFGWAVPTSTDLVKDGAVAIETLGDAIDASLVDLKGGTTGQVLKKNSNTDMDFVWSSDSAGMTNPMTTTGDTIYSSSGSTPARLGIGSTGQVLTVSGGVPTWAAASSGLTLITTQSFSAATTISINNCFSSTYDHYKVVITGTGSTSGNINARYRVSGADNTTTNYGSQRLTVGGTSVNPAQLSGSTVIDLIDIGTNEFVVSAEFFNPFASKKKQTFIQGNGFYPPEMWTRVGYFNDTTSFTGLSFLVGSATATGTVSVWGYSK